MNIDDVKNVPVGSKPLAEIFKLQRGLIETYRTGIDKGLPTEIPVNLHWSNHQSCLKDFAWRITEELGEALEARWLHSDIPSHYDEEIIDALHFLVEFTILAGIDERELVDLATREHPVETQDVDGLVILYVEALIKPMFRETYPKMDPKRDYKNLALVVGIFVEALATTCNTLKNKPWKQTQMMTDIDYFKKKLAEAWIRFIQICIVSGITELDLYRLYFKKQEVNKFRQRSNY